jgi:HPt (histidine-containing phosphotransfer) domain-containing protein
MDEMKALIKEAVRVSKELSRIDGGAETTPRIGVVTGKSASQEDPAHEIQRLRSLRYGGDDDGMLAAHDDEESRAAGSARPDDKAKLIELFVAEASPQLLFCDGAIRALLQAEERAFELGYLFRVAQTLAIASGAIGAQRMARLARTAEHFYTALRVKPRSVTPDVVALAQRTNDSLRAEVDRLSVETAAAGADDGLEQLLQEILRATAALEPGRLSKAS